MRYEGRSATAAPRVASRERPSSRCRLSSSQRGCLVALESQKRRDVQGQLHPQQPRLRRPGALVHNRGVEPPACDVREAHELPGQASPGGTSSGARGRSVVPARVARRQEIHLHTPHGLPLQRRDTGPGRRLRARDQPSPHARARGRSRFCAGHRRCRSRSRRSQQSGYRGGGEREPTHREVQAAGLRLRRPDEHAGLLRRSADASHRPRGSGRPPRVGSVLHRRIRSRRARRADAEPLLPGNTAAPRRPLRRRPPGRHVRRRARPDRERAGRLGLRPVRRGFLSVTRAGPEVRNQPVALLCQAGHRPEGVPPERLAPAVPEQCGTAQGGQLRARPAGDRAPGRSRQSPCRPTDRSVPAAGNPRIPGRPHLPGPRSGRSTGESPRTGAYAERQSPALDIQCPGRSLRLRRSSSAT